MTVWPLRLLLALVIAACGLPKSNSQTATSGALVGVVTDQSSALIPGANVQIRDDAKGTIQSASTDRAGAYQFPFLQPAKYRLSVANPGFQEERRLVTIQAGPPITVNVTLQIAKTSSEIEVADEAPIIQAESADVSLTLNQRQISELPNPGNDLTYIPQATPGAVMNTDGGFGAKFSILGMPGFSYGFTEDGMDITNNYINSVRGGPLGVTLGTNQTEEVTILTSINSSQFDGAAGGNINYVSKSGSNALHGNAQYYWNGTLLNANDWFLNALGNPRPHSIANQWAASLGGPIREDKLFFFFNTEGLRLAIPQTLLHQIPSPEFERTTIANIRSKFGDGSASDLFYNQIFELYNHSPGIQSAKGGGFLDSGCGNFKGLGMVPCARHFVNSRTRPSQDTLTSGRLDWNIGQNDRAFFRVQEEGGVAALYSDPVSSAFDSDLDNSRWQGQLVETHTFSTATAAQFLVGVSDHYWNYKASHQAESLAAFPTFLDFSSMFDNLGTFNPFCGVDTRALQISADLMTAKGGHNLGFGTKVDREEADECAFKEAGKLNPQTMQAFYEGGFDPASPNIDFTTLVQSFTSQPQLLAKYGGVQIYAQDQWRARKNLVLTFALRAEHRANFRCQNHCFARLEVPFEEINHDPKQAYNLVLLNNQEQAFQNLDRIDWSPRLGLAWQPFGLSRNSVLRAGVSILHDPFQEALGESFFLNSPTYNTFSVFGNNLAPNETSNLFRDAADSNQAFVNGFGSGKTLADFQADIPNFSPPGITSATTRMHRPQYQRWSLQWEQAMGVRAAVSVGYFGHHGIHELVMNPNANAFGFGSLPAAQCDSPPVPPCSDRRFSRVSEWSTRAISNYNGIVASFRHQLNHWGNGLVQVNYTYGHALDEVSNGGFIAFTQGSSLAPQDPANLRGAYGPAEYDVRHSMNANYVWEVPVKTLLQGRVPMFLLDGWQVSGTFFARTGFPYTVFDMAKSENLRQNNYFGQIYAVPVGPLPKESGCGEAAAVTLSDPRPCLPYQYSVQNGTDVPSPNALFVQATCETDFNTGHIPAASGPCNGNLVTFSQGRNRFRGPSYFNTDLAFLKITRIPGWESGSLALGFQFFNVLNHPNFGIPNNWSSDSTFGLIFYGEEAPSSILGGGFNAATAARMIQLRAELKF